jgi:translocation and assembly module TamA
VPLPEARSGARALTRGRRVALGLGLVAAVQLGCVHLQGTAEQPAILNVRVEGMKALDRDDLEARLATHASDRSLPIPIVGPLLHQTTGLVDRVFRTHTLKVSLVDPDQLAVDRQRIEAYYRERGYYDTKVSEAEVVPTGDRQADVVFRVVEGEPVRVTSLDITGLDAAPEARTAVGKLPLAPGDRFTVQSYDAARGRLLDVLKNTGWATAQVGQEAQVLPEEHRVLVRYAVDTGPRFRFGPIFVAGAGSVPRDRIRDQAGLEIRPGRWYDESNLMKAQGRVFDMGVFGGVRVNRGTPDAQRGTIPVVVAVREAPFRTIRAGPSVDSQGIVSSGSRVDLQGIVGWTHRNFFGGLRKLDLSLRAGYALLSIPRKEGPVALAAADFSQPAAIARNIDAGVRLELERGLDPAYDFWSERVRVSFPVRAARRWTLVPSFNVEVYQVSNLATGGINEADPTHPATLQVCKPQNAPHQTCLLSYLEQRVGWDGRNDPLNPRRGAYAAISVQEGANLGGYGYRYLRFLPDLRIYLPVRERSVLAARAQWGALVPVNEPGKTPPLVARFYAGGPNSIRGYGVNRLSPMVPFNGSLVPVGGNGLALYSVELRFPISGSLFGAIFTDAAAVSAASSVPSAWKDALSGRNLQFASGAGIRYRTPFGPLRLDLAARLPTDSGRFPRVPQGPEDPTLVHEEPIVAFHLTIGEAF